LPDVHVPAFGFVRGGTDPVVLGCSLHNLRNRVFRDMREWHDKLHGRSPAMSKLPPKIRQ
jgi:hypothetical protein